MVPKKKILKSNISTCSYRSAIDEIILLSSVSESSYVCLVNVHMLIEAWDNKNFAEIVNQADLALPDGMPVAKSVRYIYGQDQNRIAGMDLMEDLMREIEKKAKAVYLFGSTEETLRKIHNKSKSDFPSLKLYSYSPPFRPLDDSERLNIISQINEVNPDFVFVALGCPEQEKWMNEHKGKINSCMIGLGGAFSIYSGEIERSPLWMQKNNLEWLYRLYKEPRRLWKRYLYTNNKFLILVFVQFFKHRLFKMRF